MSTDMTFENLKNTRDLGGMMTADGRRIKPGRLIRSGRLVLGSEADIARLAPMIDLVVDFRSEKEREEGPDPEMPGVENVHIPILNTSKAGVSREKETDQQVRKIAFDDPASALSRMRRVYENFIEDEYCVSQYRKFIDLILAGREKAILWHCTAGKDRAGFAATIIEELLGVDKDTIMADYLLTNERLQEETAALVEMFRSRSESWSEAAEEAARVFFSAHEEYLKGAYAKVEEHYGDFEGFIARGLGVTPEEREKLRQMYLE